MAHHFVLNIIILSFIGDGSMSTMLDSWDCNIAPCRNTTIDCVPNSDCFVSCVQPQSCIASTINCPINGDCNIECFGQQACQDTIINVTLLSGNFNLLCQGSIDHCNGIQIHGSTLEANIGDFNVSCNGNRACMESIIDCPVTGNCSISCNGFGSCRKSDITGPIHGSLDISCNGEKSCVYTTFDASQSMQLDIKGCVDTNSCLDITLFCPPNNNGVKKCFLEGNDNLARNKAEGTRIYAMNGWNDIEIDYSGTFDVFHGGEMFCGDNYNESCIIASDHWFCSNIDDYCNFQLFAPTNIPTSITYDIIQQIDPISESTVTPSDIEEESESLNDSDHIKWTLEVGISFIMTVLAMSCALGIYFLCRFKNTQYPSDNVINPHSKPSEFNYVSDHNDTLEEEEEEEVEEESKTDNISPQTPTPTPTPLSIQTDATMLELAMRELIWRPKRARDINNISNNSTASSTDFEEKNKIFANSLDIVSNSMDIASNSLDVASNGIYVAAANDVNVTPSNTGITDETEGTFGDSFCLKPTKPTFYTDIV